RRHTSFSRDWSSDVCSSDLLIPLHVAAARLGVDLIELGEMTARGDVELRFVGGDHYSITEESVTAYLERSRIPVGEGPPIGDYAEADFQRSKHDTDDTPNDEGDDQQ